MIDIYNSEDFRCTCFFNGWWLKGCISHDYSCGDAQAKQSLSMRLQADKQLYYDVYCSGTTDFEKTLSPYIAFIMYLGVSIHRVVVCKYIRGYK